MSKSTKADTLTGLSTTVMNTSGKRLLGMVMMVFVAVALGGFSLYSWAISTPQVSLDKVIVGVKYVAPPFVGGDKVRTPDAIDTALLDIVAARLEIPYEATVLANPDDSLNLLLQGKLSAVLNTAEKGEQPASGTVSIPVGYPVRARAIMRTDTNIKRWDQLAGRTVCLSQGSMYVGQMASRYGAIEQIYPAPADALLALRTGGCDATVHDDLMLTELLRLPEWQKFSASLTTDDERQLRFLVAANQPKLVGALQQLAAQWQKQSVIPTLNQSRARDIAFEVYLDQAVTDCH